MLWHNMVIVIYIVSVLVLGVGRTQLFGSYSAGGVPLKASSLM